MSPQAGELLVRDIVPRLRAAFRNTSCSVGSEDADELRQDAIAIAAGMLHRLESSGKTATPGTVAFYAAKLVKSGRRSAGSRRADAMAAGTQLSGRSTVQSLDEPVAHEDEETYTLADMLASQAEDPGMAAARNLDWEQFLDGCNDREQLVIRALVEGGQLQEAARDYGASASCFSSVKRELAREVESFLGPTAIADAIREPAWKDGIRSHREKQASRWERSRER